MTSREKVLSVYPDAWEHPESGTVWTSEAAGRSGGLAEYLGESWGFAAVTLPPSSPAAETAIPDIRIIFPCAHDCGDTVEWSAAGVWTHSNGSGYCDMGGESYVTAWPKGFPEPGAAPEPVPTAPLDEMFSAPFAGKWGAETEAGMLEKAALAIAAGSGENIERNMLSAILPLPVEGSESLDEEQIRKRLFEIRDTIEDAPNAAVIFINQLLMANWEFPSQPSAPEAAAAPELTMEERLRQWGNRKHECSCACAWMDATKCARRKGLSGGVCRCACHSEPAAPHVCNSDCGYLPCPYMPAAIAPAAEETLYQKQGRRTRLANELIALDRQIFDLTYRTPEAPDA